MTKWRLQQRHTKTAALRTWHLVRTGASGLGWVSGKVRTTTSTMMRWGFGPNTYRRKVDDVAGRLADALNVMDAILAAQHLEIERLRWENARLKAERR